MKSFAPTLCYQEYGRDVVPRVYPPGRAGPYNSIGVRDQGNKETGNRGIMESEKLKAILGIGDRGKEKNRGIMESENRRS